VKGWAGAAGRRIAGGGEDGTEFAGGESVQCAEAGGQFSGGDATLTIEPAKEIGGRGFALAGVALDTSGD
jgi:hypothetical protein